MPYHEPEPEDPAMLVGNVVDCKRGELHDMAAAFASELAQMGHDRQRILRVFRGRSYAGPHLAWSELGEQRIREIVEESIAFWGRCRFVDRDPHVRGAGRRPASIESAGRSRDERA